MHRRKNEVYEEDLGIDLPQGIPDDTTAPRKVIPEGRQRSSHGNRKGGPPKNSTGWMISFSILIILVLVAAYFLVADHEERQIQHVREDFMHQQVEPLAKEWEVKYAKLEEENQRLRQHEKEFLEMKQENDQMKEREASLKTTTDDQNELVDYLKMYQRKIHKRIQSMSKTLLLEKYGPGPHQVEINVRFIPGFPKKEETDEDEQKIIIEMAPVDEMPHVVFFFLEQVTRGLYDGCSFHRNAGHVVQGGPAPNFLSPPNPRLNQRFKESGFYSILFQEYSPAFPHEKYTLGLAGRPGGPDFYVSTLNNTNVHGPGGQTSYDDPSEADSCFAKVIEGHEVVDRMQLGPVKAGGYRALADNVAIISMKMLS